MLSVLADGITRSKEVINLLYDAGVGVSYNERYYILRLKGHFKDTIVKL